MEEKESPQMLIMELGVKMVTVMRLEVALARCGLDKPQIQTALFSIWKIIGESQAHEPIPTNNRLKWFLDDDCRND